MPSTPLPPGLKLDLQTGPLLADASCYRTFIGQLLYLAMTRPNLSYGVQHLSQFVASPWEPHLQVAGHPACIQGAVS